MNETLTDLDWESLCRLCDLAQTRQCGHCTTRSRAFRRVLWGWRWSVGYLAAGASVVVVLSVVR